MSDCVLVLMILFSDRYITGTDIMGLLISVRPFHQVSANMDLYRLGVQE
jgi:hypothetical protein